MLNRSFFLVPGTAVVVRAIHAGLDLWDAPHIFNAEMQDEAFLWMDRMFAPSATSVGTTVP